MPVTASRAHAHVLRISQGRQGIFILTDAEAPHSTHISLKIGNAQVGIAMLSAGI